MNPKFLISSALFVAACTAGPERPQTVEFMLPVIELRGRIVDPPADGVDSVVLTAYWIDPHRAPVGQAYVADSLVQGMPDSGQGVLQFRMIGENAGYPNGKDFGNLRFFRLVATLGRACPEPKSETCSPNVPGYWEEPGLLLAYSTQGAQWSPFGPAGQTVTVPPGYSLLKRTCGPAAGQAVMEVRPVDDVVELRYRDKTYPVYSDFDVEDSERAFVATCGAVLPTVDMGVRASFDVAETMVWSNDGASIYYFSPPSDSDPTHSVGLRQVRLADSSSSELAIIPEGRGLQVGKPGELFVSTRDALLRITLGASTTMAPVPLAGSPGGPQVSPDGRWLGYTETLEGTIGVPVSKAHVVDLDTGVSVADLDGIFGGWSPDGRFAFWSFADPTALNVASITQPTAVLATYPLRRGSGVVQQQALIWTKGGLWMASTPLIWMQDPYQWGCTECFGLALTDPSTGGERQLLDASAGLLSIAESPALDTVVVGAQKCLGLWQTVCWHSLLRINVTDGSAQTLATLSSSVPTAISPDGRLVASATSKGIYVKNLAH
jgi:hypothetical protein